MGAQNKAATVIYSICGNLLPLCMLDPNAAVSRQLWIFMRPVIFLDRDGTINKDFGYVISPGQLELLPQVAEAIAQLKAAGVEVIIVTNQSAIGRGFCDTQAVIDTNQALIELLVKENAQAQVDQLVFCPHAPSDNCACRKPKTALVEEIVSKYSLGWQERSYVVGDKLTDMEFGENLAIPLANLYLLESESEAVLDRSKKYNIKSTLSECVSEIIKKLASA